MKSKELPFGEKIRKLSIRNDLIRTCYMLVSKDKWGEWQILHPRQLILRRTLAPSTRTPIQGEKQGTDADSGLRGEKSILILMSVYYHLKK